MDNKPIAAAAIDVGGSCHSTNGPQRWSQRCRAIVHSQEVITALRLELDNFETHPLIGQGRNDGKRACKVGRITIIGRCSCALIRDVEARSVRPPCRSGQLVAAVRQDAHLGARIAVAPGATVPQSDPSVTLSAALPSPVTRAVVYNDRNTPATPPFHHQSFLVHICCTADVVMMTAVCPHPSCNCCGRCARNRLASLAGQAQLTP